ncbi:MAG: hypothetical protein BA865_11905 [Desulfobacterales bacterium S5133MH4]|jgi:hypothetical protein|nr:MAG: hypothetical protein BA865_11905 [Desulfobacterales bacterium S5133MH4]
MHTQVVKPSGASREGVYFILVTAIVVAVAGILIMHRTRVEPQKLLFDYQISGYKDLNNFEQGTFVALYTAAMEIDASHDDNEGTWLSVRDLQEQFMPPFARDRAWETSGKLAWTQKILNREKIHMTAYLGKPSEPDISGSFLLVLSHSHSAEGDYVIGEAEHDDEPFKIWYTRKAHVDFPEGLNIQSLTVKGWKEVVPYKGEEERRRIKG